MTFIKKLFFLGGLFLLPGCSQFLDTAHTTSYATVYVVSVDGTNTRQVSPELSHHYGSPDWSPDGTHVVYASSDLGDLFVSPVTGGSVVNLTDTSDLSETGPKWSPDGSYVAYYVGSGSVRHLYVRLSDGTSSQLILENVSQFAWSPDAAYLAVVSDTKLYLLTVGGVNQGVLTEALDETQPVSWLSTTLIRYTNEDTAYLVTTSGVSFGVMDTTDASWTLPTTQLVRKPLDQGYYLVSSDGSVQKVLAHASDVALGADGNTLISVYQQSVYRHAADGSGSEWLYSATAGSVGKNMSLKGTSLLFVSGTGIYAGPIATGSPIQIATGLAPVLSTDGTQVSYVGFRRVSE